MNFKAGIFLFCVLLGTSALAQNTIKGKVFTPESQAGHNHASGAHQGEEQFIPLPGATVIWKGTRSGTMTDAHGFFKLPAMNQGDTLQVSMVGYETVGLVYKGQKYVEIPLRQGVEIDAAEVDGTRKSTSISLLDPLNVQQLNRKELAKAACCKLSSAFETNASVDASFTDAVTGTRQIRMLGLDGKFSQILVDNLPGPRGLNVIQGLNFIPGPWIDGIAISKGTGSVTNGYESITGQINVAMRNPENAEPLHINVYASGDGRTEWNHVSSHKINRKWSTALLSHAENASQLNDRNFDSFLDTPLKRDIVLRNEWKYSGDRGIRGEYSITGVRMNHMAGQKAVFDSSSTNPFGLYQDLLQTDTTGNWSAATKIDRVEASAKTGYVFPGKEWQSIGTQFYGSYHSHEHRFGIRSYEGIEKFFRGNVLLSSIIGNTDHKFTTGASFLYDDFYEYGNWGNVPGDEEPMFESRTRTEVVPGAFFEYTWTANERLVAVAGLRGDFHNLYGAFASPRLHIRYCILEETSIKLVAGRGFRTANVLMEQIGSWASNRKWYIQDDLQPEIATNLGLNLVSKFKLNSRDASLSLDGYYTDFDNRVVIDLYASSGHVEVYNLSTSDDRGDSRSITVQAEFDWSVHRRLDVRTAYRWVDARTVYMDFSNPNQLRQDPFIAKHRAFTQWSYASKPKSEGQQLRIDGVLQWVGPQELPDNMIDSPYHPTTTPSFTQANLQVSQTFKDNFELYVGVENIFNVVHENPIVGAIQTIEGPEVDMNAFDASLVYGPIFGRMTYVGLRWTLGAAKS
ncbi:MAG: hypothetical protein CMB32_02315 [Euryarchaeota archaeon]|nr:hypothetical protein [Euryarchaeota archaeon]